MPIDGPRYGKIIHHPIARRFELPDQLAVVIVQNYQRGACRPSRAGLPKNTNSWEFFKERQARHFFRFGSRYCWFQSIPSEPLPVSIFFFLSANQPRSNFLLGFAAFWAFVFTLKVLPFLAAGQLPGRGIDVLLGTQSRPGGDPRRSCGSMREGA